ncbi:hypothetical protein SB5439_01459 [Klebsiella variicola]|nr:hypothetical protein SB5439_01459 [Klebsiella variicola]
MCNRQFQQRTAALNVLKLDPMYGFIHPRLAIRFQNGQSAINVFNFEILHRVLSVAVFFLWQLQHNDSRLKSSSVPP